MTSLNFMHNI